jgi:hypothetical protein
MAIDPRELGRRLLEDNWRQRNATQTVPVRGGSMRPTIVSGSRVDIYFTMTPCLRPGSIVYIRSGQKRIVHRLVATIGPFCLERGDFRFTTLRIRARWNVIGNLVAVRPAIPPGEGCPGGGARGNCAVPTPASRPML